MGDLIWSDRCKRVQLECIQALTDLIAKGKTGDAAYKEWVSRYPCMKNCRLLQDFIDYLLHRLRKRIMDLETKKC